MLCRASGRRARRIMERFSKCSSPCCDRSECSPVRMRIGVNMCWITTRSSPSRHCRSVDPGQARPQRRRRGNAPTFLMSALSQRNTLGRPRMCDLNTGPCLACISRR